MRATDLLVLLAFGCWAMAAVAQQPVNSHQILDQIAEAAQRTATRLNTDSFACTVSLDLGEAGNRAEFRIIEAPQMRVTSVAVNVQGKLTELTRIIERDGRWYVRDGGQSYECRPYEAMLMLPGVYALKERAGLRVIGGVEELQRLGKFESTYGSIARFRFRPSPEKEAHIRNVVQALEEVLRSAKAGAVVERARSQRAMLHEVLEKGTAVDVNLEHAFIAQNGLPGQRVIVEEFAWLPAVDPAAFDVEADDWEDRTGPLLVDGEARDDVVMIAHGPLWRPGGPRQEMDAKLLNVKTGQLRRIPYQGGVCLPGCFSQDRQKVFVTGIFGSEGKGALTEIDLLTGAHRRLAEGELQGLPFQPVLSPDGTTLAVCDLAPGAVAAPGDSPTDFLRWQILLVDVASGIARPLGEPLDTAFLSWLPDGGGLILITRKFQAHDKPSLDAIARMDLDGTVTELRPGSMPSLVLNGTRILFEDQESRQWFTCDLSGGDSTMIGNGLSKFGFPTVSPDGDRLVMMYFDEAVGPRPHVIDVRTGKTTPIPVGDGIWASPSWK